MNAGHMRVGFGALDTASMDLKAGADKIEARLNELENELAHMRSDWEGNASEAYQVAKKQWDQGMQEMRAVLAQIGMGVANANGDYQSGERSNTAMWG